jgi:hypothetical protein
MRIGIDLDNTIIDYAALLHSIAVARGWLDEATSVSKASVRKSLVDADGNDWRWQRLQADAYGTHVARATAFEGALALVDAARGRGHEICILSHKTRTSQLDPSIELRPGALAWLDAAGFLGPERIPREAVYFFDTRDEKVRAIAALGCAWIVDDLLEVLQHPELPEHVARIWFTQGERIDGPPAIVSCARWDELGVLLALIDELGALPSPALRRALGRSPRVVEPMLGGGNARLRRVCDADGSFRVVKAYARDGRDRARREHDALRWMRGAGVDEVPSSLFVDEATEVAVLQHLEGSRPGPGADIDSLVGRCADFVLRLAALGRTAPPGSFGLAADARLRLGDYARAVERRLARVVQGSRVDPAARSLVSNEVEPIVRTALSSFARAVETLGLDQERELPDHERIPSPSDFGLHNVLLDTHNRVWFLDFEYFGWDDPAKLMADFLHTMAHDVEPAKRRRFVEIVVAGLPEGHAAASRLEAIDPLVRVEWILIVLNVLDPAAHSNGKGALLEQRLARASRMVRQSHDRL